MQRESLSSGSKRAAPEVNPTSKRSKVIKLTCFIFLDSRSIPLLKVTSKVATKYSAPHLQRLDYPVFFAQPYIENQMVPLSSKVIAARKGSIVRIRLHNFMTYSDIEILPG